MYAVSADSKGLDTVVGLLADVVLHPRLTGGHPGRVRGRWGWDPVGEGSSAPGGALLLEPSGSPTCELAQFQQE